MSIVYRMDGALLPFQSVRLEGNDGTNNGFPSFAMYGEPGIASVRIEDPTGSLDINGWHTFTVEETACSKPRIFSGWILGRTITRGPYRNAGGRIWQCEIIDQNALFSFEVFRSTAASVRPLETDVARVQACITSHAMAGTPIHDNGRFSTANAIDVGPGNFVGQTPAEMIRSTSGQTHKNFYAYWSDSAQQISLHYDLLGSGPAAGISISNVASDVTSGSGGTCYPPFLDASLEQDPTPIATGVLLHWAGGYVYDRNDTLIDDLSPNEFSPVNFLRDYYHDTNRISRAATAATQLQAQLQIHSVETETLTCTVQVAARDVNLCQAGDVINVRFSHIPGYTTSTAVTITRRVVEPVDGMDNLYNINLELSNSGTVQNPGGGGVGGLPLPACAISLVQGAEDTRTSSNFVGAGNELSLASPPVAGNLLVAWIILRDITTGQTLVPTGFTAIGTGWQGDPSSAGAKAMGARFFYRFVQSGDSADLAFTRTGSSEYAYVHVSEWNGADTFESLKILTSDEDQTGGSATYIAEGIVPTAGRTWLNMTGIFPSLNVNDTWHPATSPGSVMLGASGVGDSLGGGQAAKSVLAVRAGALPYPGGISLAAQCVISGISRGHAALTLFFSGTCADIPPDPGQPVNNELPGTVGGGTTVFPTDHPYADGSLKVYVDGIRQFVIETDPGAGTYQLLFDPRASEYVVVDYQARTGTD